MRRALTIDDDPTIRRLLASLLEADGWTVDAAEDAASAREALRKARYDAVLVDFVLPDVDGVDLVRELRQTNADVPIVAITGADSETVIEELLRVGAHDVLEKARLDAATLREALAGAQGLPFFTAPDRPRAPADEAAEETLVYPASGRALVVDDVAQARLLTRRLLESDGWRVDEAKDATEGLRMAFAGEYDVILLDYLLPDVDGAGLLHEMRRRRIRTPVIVLSGHGDERLAREFADQSVADYLPKDRLTLPRLREALTRATAPSVRVDVREPRPGRR